MTRKIVFLDRDGVINQLVERDGKFVSPRTFDDFAVIPGVPAAVRKLNECGFEVVVVTNQPDISRGLMKLGELELMHRLVRTIGVLEIKVCPHSDEDNCECRKPKPGLLMGYLEENSAFDSVMWMVGDQPRDWLAGEAVGAKIVRIIRSGCEYEGTDNFCSANLLEAVEKIVASI